MYFSLVITFLLLLVIIITAIQNSMPLDFKFFTWNFQISITALIFYSSLIGGAIAIPINSITQVRQPALRWFRSRRRLDC